MVADAIHTYLPSVSRLISSFCSNVTSPQSRSYEAYKATVICISIKRDDAMFRSNSSKVSCLRDAWSSLSAFLDGENGAYSDSSECLLGFSASLFHDDFGATIDMENPPKYIPPPIQSASDLEANKQLDYALYILKELIPGPICKVGMEDIVLKAWNLVHHDIKIHDPVVCLQGKDKLHSWLQTLAEVQAQVNLHEIYAERIIAQPYRMCIYAIWTLSFPGKVQSTLSIEGVCHPTTDLSLSGETMFKIDGSGQVVYINSKWYVPRGGVEMLELTKQYLISIIHKEVLTS